jgi:uncharacterized coiled-coil protein SlyX
MSDVPSSDAKLSSIARIGSQPIAFAAAALIVIVAGIVAIVLWRSTAGTSPEQERIASTRQIQARVAQASEEMAAKTKDLGLSQQESIDQLQMVQDRLQTIQQMVAAQRTETKRLSEQVAELTGSLATLRQSFASSQTSESSPPAVRSKAVARHSVRRAHASMRKRGKSRS